MRSISVKVTFLYLFLAIINISIFTFIIYENQIDLITENIKLETKETASNIYTQLNTLIEEIENEQENYNERNLIVDKVINKLNTLVDNYVFFLENGEIMGKKWPDFSINDLYLQKASRSIANRDIGGQLFYLEIIEEQNEILFYIPINILIISDAIILFPLKMEDVKGYLRNLYFLITVIISVIAIFHIAFGFTLNFLIIHPLKLLMKKSQDISRGNLTARVDIKRKDEFGTLGQSFNHMAESIESKINQLNDHNRLMQLELKMAGEVQTSIYPIIRETELFKLAVYHNPLVEVSGDFHDIFPLGNNRYGILIADISGHGISAALITMLVKDTFNKTVHKHVDARECIVDINTQLSNMMETYDKFFTAFYIIIDENRVVSFANAGHEKCILLRPTQHKLFEMTTEGSFIGISETVNKSYKSKTWQLEPKDKIILLTDGIKEARNINKEEYGLLTILKILKYNENLSCNELLDNLLQNFRLFKGNSPRKDDETILIIDMK